MPDGKRYRWLMAYAPVSTTTGLSYMVNGGVGSNVNVVAGAVCAAMGYSTSHPAIGNNSISKLAEYVVYIKDTLNSSGRASYSLPLICGKYIDIKIGEDTSAGMPSDSSCFPGAKTIINDSIAIGEKISLQASVTYFKSPTYGFKVVVSGSTASYSSLAPYGHPIKYLEITNKEAQSKLNLTPTYLHFPNLLNTDCLIGIGSISSTGLFNRTLENIKTLELPSVTSIVDDAFSGCSHKDVLSLPGMTSININTLRGANFTTIKLPNVNVLSVTPLMHPGVRELDLSGATQISSLIVSSNAEFSPQLMSIDISNATSISSSAFNYAFYLQSLKIKEGYVGELNLGKCPNLDITSVKEIFNNLGETETEYTITLASCVYYKLTAKELAIATNKGYVLKSNYSF